MHTRALRSDAIALLVGADPNLPGVSDTYITRVSAFENATQDSVVFAENEASLLAAIGSKAGLILTSLAGIRSDNRLLHVEDPRLAFAICARALAQSRTQSFRHPSAVVDESAKIGERVSIGAGAVIEAGVCIGEDVEIASGATVLTGVTIGDRVVIQAGAILGSYGFGYVRDVKTGKHVLFPQQGQLVIEDDVEIGANTTIDRGALGETRIGQGTKIDNQVHIGHNCRIGRNVLIAAQVGISGSCIVEDGAVLAGQAGLGDHVRIGRGVILGGAAGVFPGKRLEGDGQMFMGVPAEPLRVYLKTLGRIRRICRSRDSRGEE